MTVLLKKQAAVSVILLIILSFLHIPLPSQEPDNLKESRDNTLILDTKSFWRIMMSSGRDMVILDSGETCWYGGFKKVKDKTYELNKLKNADIWSLPPRGWIFPDFDDSVWVRFRGPFGIYRYRSTPVIYLRGKFSVADPAEVKKLRVSMKFQGGAVLYINGKEAKRAFLPEGGITPETPGKPYTEQAYVGPEGNILRRNLSAHLKIAKKTKKEDLQKHYALRLRTLSTDIPASLLQKGVNTAAVEIHRSPAPLFHFSGRKEGKKAVRRPERNIWWPRCGLKGFRLECKKSSGVVPNAGHTSPPKEFTVWNAQLTQRITTGSYAGLYEKLRPATVYAPVNGEASAKIIITSPSPVKGLSAEASPLQGPGTIPAENTVIRYAVPDGPRYRRRQKTRTFDGLELSAPEEIPVYKKGGLAVQPVWITVCVPDETKPGTYRGSVTVTAGSQKPVAVPVILNVLDFRVPDPDEFKVFVGIIQSPHSLAMQYNVPLWSDRHWKLINRSFSLLAKAGCKTVYLPLVRQTHFGNEHSMVTWIRRGTDRFDHDFSIAEKYIDTAVHHLGKVPVVCLYCWETFNSGGKFHFGHYKPRDRAILYTIADPETGMLEEAEGPSWDSPDCTDFWRPVIEGIRSILRKHGMEKSMMVGMSGDFKPTREAVEVFKTIDPEIQWVSQQHSFTGSLYGQTVGYVSSVWGLWPSLGKGHYGWRNPVHVTMSARNRLHLNTSLATYRTLPEAFIAARGRYKTFTPDGFRGGVSRIGADFWPVIPSGRRKKTVIGRYPETAWGQLTLDYCVPYVLSPGKDGPISTVRFELFRENVQEGEARAILDDVVACCCQKSFYHSNKTDKRAFLNRAVGPEEIRKIKETLGNKLTEQCRILLGRRCAMYCDARGAYGGSFDPIQFFCSDWPKYSARLYTLAGEVIEKLEQSDM